MPCALSRAPFPHGLLFALLAAACSDGERVRTVPPQLEVTARAVDFGPVRVGEQAERSVSLRSTSAAPIALECSLEASAGGAGLESFDLLDPPRQVPANGSASVRVRFRPSSERPEEAVLVLASDDPDPAESRVRIPLRGRGAYPHLGVEVSCEPPCSGFSLSQDPPGIDFGARRPLRQDSSGQLIEPEWPSVRLFNHGEIDLAVESLAFEGATAFQATQPLSTSSFAIPPGSSQALQVRFNPTPSQQEYLGSLRVQSDDPEVPVASVALRGRLGENAPPLVCAQMVHVEQADGTPAWPVDEGGQADFFGMPPPVEPGAWVWFSAWSDHFAPGLHPREREEGDERLCTTDPEDGRMPLTLSWSLVERPPESMASLSGADKGEPSLRPDAIGRYAVELVATDSEGAAATAQLSFEALPLHDLAVQLTWGEGAVDLDLHLVRPGTCGDDDRDCLFDPEGDINGYSVLRGSRFDWGRPDDERDNPRLVWDDQGDRGRLETVVLNGARNAPECAHAPCAYQVFVHHFEDRRADVGAQPLCEEPGCVQGSSCDCSEGRTCVSGRCLTAAHPRLAIHARPPGGGPRVALEVPPRGESVPLTGPCFLWHAAQVVFNPDGSARIEAIGTSGEPVLRYYGKLERGQFGCAPNDPNDPLRYVAGEPPLYP